MENKEKLIQWLSDLEESTRIEKDATQEYLDELKNRMDMIELMVKALQDEN